MITNINTILEVLKTESIRLMDGRFSDGFVDTDELKLLINLGHAKKFKRQGLDFVKLATKQQAEDAQSDRRNGES